ncbi:hypothetical protein SFHH103_00599 [Sinorhizobium fredii HH103]|uniref:Uncharacterized protein n=1 Tax=Sinorhizobium fredii (strain HH103) TaxID=1117943 RepID=G9A209_SINF1|nr:hypothetical protein SFHH103_00599 [Sinorhizobium fredii HH103]
MAGAGTHAQIPSFSRPTIDEGLSRPSGIVYSSGKSKNRPVGRRKLQFPKKPGNLPR